MSYMSQLTGKTKEERAGELQGVISVSYTHLDVYKRQDHACAMSLTFPTPEPVNIPALPGLSLIHILTTLQRDANRLLGFTAQQTLDYLKSLYEKTLCTYPRCV